MFSIKDKDKFANLIFTIGIVLELIVMLTDHFASWSLPYRGRVTHIAFALFVLKILLTKYDIRQWVIIIICGILGVISYITCDDEYVIRAIVFVVACKSVDTNRILKIILWSTIVGSCMIVLLSLLGISGTVVDVRHYGRGVEEARYCLGFNHANNLHDVYWYICAIYLLAYNQTKHNIMCACLLVGNIALYILTKSRTGMLVTSMMLIGYWLLTNLSLKLNSIISFIISVLLIVFSLMLTYISSTICAAEDKMWVLVDKALTGRMELVWEFAPFTSWKWFPEPRTAEMIDNGYVTIVYTYGYLVLLMFCIVVLLLLYNNYKMHNSISLVVISSACLVLLMESSFVINVSLLCNMLLICTINWGESLGTKDTINNTRL